MTQLTTWNCAVLALKLQLAHTRRRYDGDDALQAPLGFVLGSAINQDGRSSSLTAPNGPSQTVLVQSALRCAELAPAAVGFVSLHGTGTPLGDPIEVGALGSTVSSGAGAAPSPRQLVLGSNKVP